MLQTRIKRNRSMNKTNTTTLIDVLARTDAIFRPMRKADWVPPAPSNLWEARRRFSSAGVLWRVGGGGANRLAGERELVGLQEMSLLVLCGKAKRSGVRLSETAEIGVRALCGLPLDAHAALCRVVLLTEEREGLCSELWIAELDEYADTDDCRNALWETMLLVLPALVRGWVASNSDVQGAVYYYPTPAGLAAAQLPAPALPTNSPKWSEPIGRFYHDQTIAARQRLRTSKPSSPSEIGECPLSASLDLRRPRRRKGATT